MTLPPASVAEFSPPQRSAVNQMTPAHAVTPPRRPVAAVLPSKIRPPRLLRLLIDAAAVIIILKSEATDDQIGHVIERVEALGLRAHLSRGTYRTIIGV